MIIFIPGAVVAVLTFPGVVLHEMAHKFFCDFYRVPVYNVKYFAISKNAGHVIHEASGNSREKAIISLAPFLINSLVCFLLLIPKIFPLVMGTSFVSTFTFPDIFLTWVGFSCGVNAIPSKTDLAHIDSNVSWPFIFLKRFAQICNFIGFAGGVIWIMILFILALFLFIFVSPVIALLMSVLA
jgi:hypothetical protein